MLKVRLSMNPRIKDKIEEIETLLREMYDFVPEDVEDYIGDNKTKAACERYFERITEAVVDLAFLIIKEKGYRIPGEDKIAFDILAKEKIIVSELAERLKNAKGMRNILAHEYGRVDDQIVFDALRDYFEEDVVEFLTLIRKLNL